MGGKLRRAVAAIGVLVVVGGLTGCAIAAGGGAAGHARGSDRLPTFHLPAQAAGQAVAVIPPPAQPAPHGSLQQTVSLSVRPGSLRLAQDTAAVTLTGRRGRHWIDELDPIRVADARGSLVGWTVSASLVEVVAHSAAGDVVVPDARVRFQPGRPSVVDGAPEGLRSGNTSIISERGSVPFFSSVPPWGGGTYESSALVDVVLPRGMDADGVTVHLAFSVR